MKATQRIEVESRGASDVEQMMFLDPETLDKSKHYRFVQERPTNVAKKKALGYELVLREESGVKLLTDDERGTTADNYIRVGDCVLMQCDKERFNERRSKVQKMTDLRKGAIEKDFAKQARQGGVRSLKDDEGE